MQMRQLPAMGDVDAVLVRGADHGPVGGNGEFLVVDLDFDFFRGAHRMLPPYFFS
jgi:hypothetical protein